MQLKWADPTNSIAREPWVKEGDKLVKKNPNEFYEDKLAINWNANNSVADFNKTGCAIVCHATDVTDPKTGKRIVKHWTNGNAEIGLNYRDGDQYVLTEEKATTPFSILTAMFKK